MFPDGRVSRQGAAGKCVERQCETKESLGSGVLVQAENLFSYTQLFGLDQTAYNKA